MPKRSITEELLKTVRDEERACVDRGKAIEELRQRGMKQADIAYSTRLSRVYISHLKKCFLNLKGDPREMCKTGKMNGDACYSLANAPDSDREIIFRRAVEIRKAKDSKRSEQNVSPKGRQTRRGQITDKDMKEAIMQITKEE